MSRKLKIVSVFLSISIMLLMAINAIFIRDGLIFREPFWISGKVVDLSCAKSSHSTHSIALDDVNRRVLVMTSVIRCADLKQLADQTVSVKVSYAYGSVPYSFELKYAGFQYKSERGEEVYNNQNNVFTSGESVLILFLGTFSVMYIINILFASNGSKGCGVNKKLYRS